MPSELPFIAMSRDAGEILEQAIFNATGPPGVIEMLMDVTNDEERTIYVPCGEIRGKSSRWSLSEGTTTPSTTHKAPSTIHLAPPA